MPDPSDTPNLEGADPQLVEAAVFGREVEIFIDEHPVAQYIVDRAKKDMETAQAALLEVDPEDSRKIRQLQFDAQVANRVRSWLAEAVQNGRDAAVVLKQERAEYGV